MVVVSDREKLKENSLLINLARAMAGDFSNYKQSQDNPKDYAHIRVFFSSLTLAIFLSDWVLFRANL